MDGTIERISPSVAYRSGYSSEELIGQNVHDLYAIPEQRQRFLAELTARGSVEDFHITLCSKQGVLVDVSINAALVTDAEGRPVAIDGSLRDITERKRIEVELRRSELRYRTLAENFPNGSVFLFDRDLRFTLAEGEGLRVSGPRKEEIEGKTLREVFGTELCEILEPAYRAALQGKSSVLEAGYADQIYSVHVLPVKDENDVVHSGMVVTQDITERKRVEAEREDLVRKLQEALASIRTLRGLVPICSSCRKIRNDSGYWQQVEDYVREHSDVRFSHGLCGDCARRLYPDLFASAGKNSKAS
jgi:PAS domain S-box-containing protein